MRYRSAQGAVFNGVRLVMVEHRMEQVVARDLRPVIARVRLGGIAERIALRPDIEVAEHGGRLGSAVRATEHFVELP